MSHRNKELLRLLLSMVVGGVIAYAILHRLHSSAPSVERLVHMVALPAAGRHRHTELPPAPSALLRRVCMPRC